MAAVPRFRFSPSPTGFLHVGGARTALFNWFAARQQGGEFLLRIEDTDTARNREEWVVGLQDSLRWLGIDWDGEPLRQSTRMERYREVAGELLDRGLAYWCDCTPDDLKARQGADAQKGYDGFCRDRGLERSDTTALRFRAPDTATTSWDDLIRGPVSFENAVIEDFVILRSNGTAVFLLANAVDDLDQEITHVVRGEEHVNGTPKYLLLRSAIAGDEIGPPVFAHLPVIVNEKRQKLSKRRDDVALEGYRDRGYLPEAMANYLALLGWGPPDGVEIRPLSEIVELFRLEDVGKSSAFFDVKKLDNFNGNYTRGLSREEFLARVGSWAEGRLGPLVDAVQERVERFDQVPGMVDFVFLDEPVLVASMPDNAAVILDEALAEYAVVDWTAKALHEITAAIAARHDVRLGKAQAPIRIAVTGRTVGPPLFESLEVLGRERTRARLQAARDRLG